MPDPPLPVVVVADPIDAAAVELLRAGPCRVFDATSGPDALESSLPEAWGILVRSRTKVTRELIERAPHLQFVARAGVGVDNVDLTAANARGIRVVNAPTAATVAVAELTVCFLLLLARGLYPRIVETKAGRWKRGENGGELRGKTVGFVGYGRIARETAKRLAAFGVTTVAFDPFVTVTQDATTLLPLDDLLKSSDFVSLHAALTPENHHLINAGRLAQMKPNAALVNVARGPLVDEEALLAALESGHLGGAALDVFEDEPPTRAKLLAHPKVLATPHLGASTREGQSLAGRQVVEETLRALQGEPLQAWVNPEAKRSAP
ncbi:MAG: hydroxyacid dehydrogenase [Thermoplasmata archaeon]|nr:hydroxyacid dehydrogenase [Thermoplasmata archaeon]MCI4356182.1 hydroxyacid dehydrogenase [Thermoplasmata archaeon]